MSQLKKIVESKMKIRFHDCDPFNHLNNSRYVDYIMAARGDQLLENYNFDIYKLAQERGVGWVMGQLQISYLLPARLMEEVIIETQLLSYSEKVLHMEGFMWNKDRTSLKSMMWAKLVHYNLKHQRSHEHDDDLMSFFGEIVNPLPIKTSFEERVQSIKTKS
ncbi:MAG: acyl-CoA thioesterase [Bacteroidota bacterium]